MIQLPVFNNYENVDINDRKKEKDTIFGALKELSGTGLSGPTMNELNRVFNKYIKYFRFLNNYRIRFDAILNGLIQGANVSKQFDEFMEEFQRFDDVHKYMESCYKNQFTKKYEIKLLTKQGMQFLEMKGYAGLFQQDYTLFTDKTNIDGFAAFDKMVHVVYENYHNYITENGVDQWKLFSDSTKYIEEHFETLFNSLLDDISKIQDPKEARKIAIQQTKHIWREILPPCDEDNRQEGIRLVNMFFGYKYHVMYGDIIKMYTDIIPFVFKYLNDIKPWLIHFPYLGNYYTPQIQNFEVFLSNHIKYMIETIQKLFPYYITKSKAEESYNKIINANHIPPNYIEYFKKYKKWFEDIGETVDEKIKNIETGKKNEKTNEQLNKLIKQKDKILKNMSKAEKTSSFNDYKNERKSLKNLIKDLEKLNISDSTNVINDIKEIIANTKQKKKEIKIKSYILNLYEYSSIKENIKFLDQAFEEKNYESIKPFKDNIKREYGNLQEKIDNFEGDVEELKKSDFYKEISEKVNEALKRELPGGKSLEAVKLEQYTLPVVNAYLPTIDTYANMPPNPMMIASVMMVKTNIINEVNKLRPYINESEELKKCVETADNKLKLLDEYVVKCSAPPK